MRIKKRAALGLCVCVAFLGGAAVVRAQPGWKPTQNVEIIAPAAAGGANDQTARLVHRLLQDAQLVPQSMSVINKPGGGHSIGLAYLNRRPGDAHNLMVETSTMLVNELTGKLNVRHTDITPIAVLYKDYITISVRADSPLKTGRDFIARLKSDPGTLSIALSSALANSNHLAAALIARSAGADVRKMKIVVFNSGAETMTALMGGHVDAVAGPAVLAARHAPEGKIRVLGVTAPQRLGAVLAQVPTFNEQGAPAVMANWRSVIGPKGMTAAQITYWDQALAKIVQADDYKKEVERNLADSEYLGATAARKYWDAQYAELKGLLNELGLSK
ncbi:MAG: tripartite tricarboxylate transporter substrate binding protein [Burkholderiales bacterium]